MGGGWVVGWLAGCLTQQKQNRLPPTSQLSDQIDRHRHTPRCYIQKQQQEKTRTKRTKHLLKRKRMKKKICLHFFRSEHNPGWWNRIKMIILIGGSSFLLFFASKKKKTFWMEHTHTHPSSCPIWDKHRTIQDIFLGGEEGVLKPKSTVQ